MKSTGIGSIVLSVLLLSALTSCRKEKNTVVDPGYNYFPNNVGHYVVYDVDSIVYDDFNSTVDTFKFQLKEYIQSIFMDNANRPTQRIERYKRKFNKSVSYTLIPWVLQDVWSANLTNAAAEKVEENQRFVKLVFAVSKNKTWNGNAQNTLGAQDYKYTFVHEPAFIGGTNFDSALVVTQLDKENLIEKQSYYEVYAKNTGMVSKQVIDVKSKTITIDPIMERITSGLIYRATYNSSGN